MKNEKVRNIAYWLTTILGPASFVIGGTLSLSGADQVVTTLQHLGYPAYFATILGVWKLLGAIVITAPRLPRLKEWAYAGFVFDLTAAAFSHASVGDRTGDIVVPLAFLGLVLASWALRPESRRLASPAPERRAAAASPASDVLTAPAGA
jgi:uncharacterized membrane protein YphA (DoxX/SURF4 family)